MGSLFTKLIAGRIENGQPDTCTFGIMRLGLLMWMLYRSLLPEGDMCRSARDELELRNGFSNC
jgi:hypothetical protein